MKIFFVLFQEPERNTLSHFIPKIYDTGFLEGSHALVLKAYDKDLNMIMDDISNHKEDEFPDFNILMRQMVN